MFLLWKQNVSGSETCGGTGTEPPTPWHPQPSRAVLVDQGDDCRRSIESGIRSPCRPEPRTTTFIIFSPPGTIRRRVPVAVQMRRNKKSEFVTKLEEVLPLLRERFGVAKIGIFGSAARGEERPDSDVDVLVEFAPGQTTFRNFMELAFYLEELFGRRVDLVTEQGLSQYLRPYVEQEVVWCDA